MSYPLPGNVKNGMDDLIVLDQPSEPSVLWIENGTIKRLSLLTRKVNGFGGRNFARLVDVGLGENGVFVAQHIDETAVVFQASAEQDPRQIWAFADSVRIFWCLAITGPLKAALQARSDKQSPSLYSGGIDKEGRPYVSRIFYAFAAKVGAFSTEAYVRTDLVPRWLLCHCSFLTL